MGGRIYDPAVGSVLTPDPVIVDPADRQAYNPCAYVLNNPATYTDPSGFWPCDGGCGDSVASVGQAIAGGATWLWNRLAGNSEPNRSNSTGASGSRARPAPPPRPTHTPPPRVDVQGKPPAASPPAPWGPTSWQQLGAGVLSHETALSLQGLSDALPAQVHVTLPAAWKKRRFRVPEGVVLHHADIESKERTWAGPVPITSVSRTLNDVATSRRRDAILTN
jgi:hypothetical protein